MGEALLDVLETKLGREEEDLLSGGAMVNWDTLPPSRLNAFRSDCFLKASKSGFECRGRFEGGDAATERILVARGLYGTFNPRAAE